MANETKLTNLVNPEVMGDMIEAKLDKALRFVPYAKVDTTLQGVPGDTKTVPYWNFIGAADEVAEGIEVDLTTMTSETRTFTIKKAMKAVGITQESVNSGLGDPIGQAELQLAKSLQVKIDNDSLAALLTGSNYYDAEAYITYDGIVDSVDIYDEEGNAAKVMFVNPKQVTKLRKDTSFLAADKYEQNRMLHQGEIGMICNTHIVPSKKVPTIKYLTCESTATGALKVIASGTAGASEVLAATVAACTLKLGTGIISPAANDYVVALTAEAYVNPIIKVEPSDPDTEYTEDELAALTFFLKKDTQVDTDWKPRTQIMEITASKYYGTALTNGAKVVLALFKK